MCDAFYYTQSGYVRTKRGYYIIEPAEDHDPLSGKQHPHLLYSHDADSMENLINCDTSGDLAKVLSKRAGDEEIRDVPKNNTELHIEALVVIDKTMLNYHKNIDVENYVLTVFNMVSFFHTLINYYLLDVLCQNREKTILILHFFSSWDFY